MKAINNLESPPKEKHVRNLILGTFHERSALPFWYNALKLQLYGNAIVCWKFCYTLHKMMRDGFASTVDESFRYVATLEDLAKSWIHLKHDYGNMLFHYCNFLSFKLKFHKKNKLIPANLQIEINNLNELAIGANLLNGAYSTASDANSNSSQSPPTLGIWRAALEALHGPEEPSLF